MSNDDSYPDSLLNLCCKFCAQHLEMFCEVRKDGTIIRLKDSVSLPQELAEKLINSFQEYTDRPVTDSVINILSEPWKTRVEKIHIPDSRISDAAIKVLFRHKIVDLNVNGAFSLTSRLYETITERGAFLKKLNCSKLEDSLLVPTVFTTHFLERGFVFQADNLNCFVGKDLNLTDKSINLLMQPLANLLHLDLSGSCGLSQMDFLKFLPQLSSLVLFNVNASSSLRNICSVKTLKHLDISQGSENPEDPMTLVDRPQEVLHFICQSLPLLSSLDISGTNLTDGFFDDEFKKKLLGYTSEDFAMTDIPGLISRIRNPLQFLGVFDTDPAVSHKRFPAIKVSGCTSEVEVLTALRLYMDREQMVINVLNEVFQIFRHENFEDHKAALDLILEAMNRYLKNRQIQISGSASLFYIIKNLQMSKVCFKVKQRMLKTLLKGVDEHKTSSTMLRNGCLSFCRFDAPRDFLTEFPTICRLLLYIIENNSFDTFILKMAMFVLNSLVCDVNYKWKLMAADLHTIPVMLSLINTRISEHLCDDTMEFAWSIMWNITDEMPGTCEEFVKGNGLQIFLKSLEKFPDTPELVRFMLGLLGNISEVRSLRIIMTQEKYLTVFTSLLFAEEDGIEIRYNAGGILSHILADGSEAWDACKVTYPSRNAVLKALQAAVAEWDLTTFRSINYRSFDPIFRLARCADCPAAQCWAIWALANLTTVSAQKYFKFIEDNNGMELLHEIQGCNQALERTKELCQNVFDNYQKFKLKDSENAKS